MMSLFHLPGPSILPQDHYVLEHLFGTNQVLWVPFGEHGDLMSVCVCAYVLFFSLRVITLFRFAERIPNDNHTHLIAVWLHTLTDMGIGRR